MEIEVDLYYAHSNCRVYGTLECSMKLLKLLDDHCMVVIECLGSVYL